MHKNTTVSMTVKAKANKSTSTNSGRSRTRREIIIAWAGSNSLRDTIINYHDPLETDFCCESPRTI
jgi:hypothetical protein